MINLAELFRGGRETLKKKVPGLGTADAEPAIPENIQAHAWPGTNETGAENPGKDSFVPGNSSEREPPSRDNSGKGRKNGEENVVDNKELFPTSPNSPPSTPTLFIDGMETSHPGTFPFVPGLVVRVAYASIQ